MIRARASPAAAPNDGWRVVARRARAAFVGAALALVCVLALELILRRLEPTSPAAFRFESNFPAKSADGLLVEHPTRFYTLRGDRRSTPEHAGRYACGAWPFRGKPPAAAESAAWPRASEHVLVLGDSCIFGQGLDVDQTLPAFLGNALRANGCADVQVTNLGVPGYSIVQIRALLDDVITRAEPVLVVLYPGAWNDQAVTMGASDVELSATNRSLLSRSAFGRRMRRWLAPWDNDDERERLRTERLAAFEAGDASVPRRVPLEDYVRILDDIRATCTTRGATLVVVAPAHPDSTHVRFPMTRTYAQRTLEWARERGVEHLDAQAVVDGTGLGDGALFLDFVHPSPLALEPLGNALSSLVVPHVAKTDARRPGQWTAQPRRVSTLGDETLELTPPVLRFDAPVPLLALGNAPLLDVERLPDGRLRGRTMANAAGMHSVHVFGDDGWSDTGARIELAPPSIAFESDAPARIVAHSRPGDRFFVRASTGVGVQPEWTPQGANWLPRELLVPYTLELTCDGRGVAEVELESLRGAGELVLHAQALVFPRGDSADRSLARYTEPIRIRLR